MDVPQKEKRIKFIKGSDEAKAHMQNLRSLRKGKPKINCSEEKSIENKKPLKIIN